jgi:hypothetical protein
VPSAAARGPIAALLQSAEISGRRPLGGGVNKSEVLTFKTADGKPMAGVFKMVKGERSLRTDVPVGTEPIREVAVSRLDETLGLHMVPTSVLRAVDNEVGSVQLFAADAKVSTSMTPSATVQLNRAAAEKMRAFDYITGNADRHTGNLMVRQQGNDYLPVAIDNGLALPEGVNTMFRWPDAWVSSHTGPLLPETTQWIKSCDPKTVAKSLGDSGIDKLAMTHVLRRLARLQKDPTFMEIGTPTGSANSSAMVSKMAEIAKKDTQDLTPAELSAIDEIVKVTPTSS